MIGTTSEIKCPFCGHGGRCPHMIGWLNLDGETIAVAYPMYTDRLLPADKIVSTGLEFEGTNNGHRVYRMTTSES